MSQNTCFELAEAPEDDCCKYKNEVSSFKQAVSLPTKYIYFNASVHNCWSYSICQCL